MRIQQSAFEVKHATGAFEFIGIVAFDAEVKSALTAAQEAWGTALLYRELDWSELRTLPSSGLSVFTYSSN